MPSTNRAAYVLHGFLWLLAWFCHIAGQVPLKVGGIPAAAASVPKGTPRPPHQALATELPGSQPHSRPGKVDVLSKEARGHRFKGRGTAMGRGWGKEKGRGGNGNDNGHISGNGLPNLNCKRRMPNQPVDKAMGALVSQLRPCKTDDASRTLSAPSRSLGASNGPGPEGLFPVPTIIGVCCAKSSSSTLYKYLGMLASAQRLSGRAAMRKELHFFDCLSARKVTGKALQRSPAVADAAYREYAGHWLPQRGGGACAPSGMAASTNKSTSCAGTIDSVLGSKYSIPTNLFCTASAAVWNKDTVRDNNGSTAAGALTSHASLWAGNGTRPAVVSPARSPAHPRKQLFSPYITYDFTPRYSVDMASPWAMQRVLPAPQTPLLLMVLRDPIQRAISGWFHYGNVNAAAENLPKALQLEVDTVIKHCYPRSYAAFWGGRPPASPGSPTFAADAVAPMPKLPAPIPGKLPDAASCSEAGDGWKKEAALMACMKGMLDKGTLKGSNKSYDRWLVRSLYADQVRNLLCAGFAPRQIIVVTLTEVATDPGNVLRRIARAVDRDGLVVDESIFDSARLLRDSEVHVVTGQKKVPHDGVKLRPLLYSRLKDMFAADATDLLALVTRRNGFVVDDKELAAEFAEILKP
eukprot:jgi/Mesvir1/8728/Mv02654-RA.1